jgi:hypothetical protein
VPEIDHQLPSRHTGLGKLVDRDYSTDAHIDRSEVVEIDQVRPYGVLVVVVVVVDAGSGLAPPVGAVVVVVVLVVAVAVVVGVLVVSVDGPLAVGPVAPVLVGAAAPLDRTVVSVSVCVRPGSVLSGALTSSVVATGSGLSGAVVVDAVDLDGVVLVDFSVGVGLADSFRAGSLCLAPLTVAFWTFATARWTGVASPAAAGTGAGG